MRIAASIPEEIPRCHSGTLPMMALLFGLWNMPIPSPVMAIRHITSKAWADCCRRLRKNRPSAATHMPDTARNLVPILSESAPLRGATNKVIMGEAAITSPTLSMS